MAPQARHRLMVLRTTAFFTARWVVTPVDLGGPCEITAVAVSRVDLLAGHLVEVEVMDLGLPTSGMAMATASSGSPNYAPTQNFSMRRRRPQ